MALCPAFSSVVYESSTVDSPFMARMPAHFAPPSEPSVMSTGFSAEPAATSLAG